MHQHKIAALILAAGYSFRMGDFKPFLQLYGESVIERSIAVFHQAGIRDIRVVVGYRADDLIPILHSLKVKPIINENYALGMFSSVLAGINSFTDEIEGFFLLPGDTPLVKSRTIEKMMEYYQTGCSVLYPSFLGQRGHPPLISRNCFNKILSHDVSGNLRLLLQEFEEDSYSIECIDQGILLDMDTPADYQKILKTLSGINIPTFDECQSIFSIYNVSESVIRHGYAVANVARLLAQWLNKRCGYSLDIELITVGGLLHDLAKGMTNHAQAGAAILEQEGFPDVAKVVASHMDIELHEPHPVIEEREIVYLADKLVDKDEVISINRRFAGAVHKNAANPEGLKKIEKRRTNAMLLKEKIEFCLGFDDLYSVIRKEDTLAKAGTFFEDRNVPNV